MGAPFFDNMLRFTAYLLLAAIAQAAPVVDAPMLRQFQGYMVEFNKSYSPQEIPLRLQALAANLLKIEQLNTIEGSEVYGLTKFSDLSAAEFKARYLTYQPAVHSDVPVMDIPATLNVSGSIDWRTKNKVTAVKDQGNCGSCWAFSATEEIETAWLMAGNPQTILSPQQITSCDKIDEGCNGGDTATAYKYVQKAGGMVTESQYQYTSGKSGTTGKCKAAKVKKAKAVSIKGFSYATTPKPSMEAGKWKAGEAKMATGMSTLGPISICVDAETWQNYKKGIVTKTCKQELDHCVQAVGYNLGGAGSKKYWIVRNSWNTDWGEDGYIRVGYGGNYCGISNEATFVQV